MCWVLNVRRSTYYKHFHSQPSQSAEENQLIASLILRIYADYDTRLSAYKITYVLMRDYGIKISAGRVYRLMKTLQLPKMFTDKPPCRRKPAHNGQHPNCLQQFRPKAPNLVWASDFTYAKVNGKCCYLCIIMELFSRKIIAWHISSRADMDFVTTSFQKAHAKRNTTCGLMFHSDCGSQYTAFSFRRLLDSPDIVQSFSKKDILLTTPDATAPSNT